MKKHKFTAAFTVIFFLCSVFVLLNAKINADYMVFLPGYTPGVPIEKIDNDEVKALVKVSEKFSDSSQVAVILHSHNTFFDSTSLQRVLKLQDEMTRVDGVKTVLSVLNYSFKKTYFDGSTLEREITQDPEAKAFISGDGSYLLLNCVLEPLEDQKPVLRRMEALLKSYSDLSPLLFGQIVINDHLFREIIRQTTLYPALMFLAILAVFYFQTRSLKASLVSLIFPIFATAIVYAAATALNAELNVMTVMTASFLLVIGSAYGLHFYNGIIRFGKEARRRMLRPIFFSMFTTAVGFLSFLFVKITAFKQLGLMVSSGLALVVLMLFTSGYELLVSKSEPKFRAISVRIKNQSIGKVLIWAVIFAMALSPFLISQIDIGMDQISYFSKNSSIGKAMRIMNEEFSYREPVFVVIEKDSLFTVKDSEVIKQIVQTLSEIDGVSSVQYPVSYPVPTLAILSRMQPAIKYFVADAKTIRIVVNITHEAYTHAGDLKENLEKALKRYSQYRFTLASASFVVDQINSQILKSQLQSLFASVIFIFLVIFFAFKKFTLSIVIIVPIALTVVFNFDFIALLNLRLDIATSIVASILVGLIVDYSIHLAHDMKSTNDVSKTIENIGMPLITNALGLIAGFLVLSLSKLALFRNVSLLIALGIGFGVCFTIFSEPLIMKKVLKKRS